MGYVRSVTIWIPTERIWYSRVTTGVCLDVTIWLVEKDEAASEWGLEKRKMETKEDGRVPKCANPVIDKDNLHKRESLDARRVD